MNAKEIVSGGYISTTTFWEVSIPLMVASVIIPVAFSGLLIRMTIEFIRSSYEKWLEWKPLVIVGTLMAFNVASAVIGGHPLFWAVWALNLLYTLEFMRWIPLLYGGLLSVSRKRREAKAARESYTSRDPSMALDSNSAVGADVARDSSASRDSEGTEISWVTANTGVIEGSSGTTASGSSSTNSSSRYLRGTSELMKIIYRYGEATAALGLAVVTLGGLGLGAAFLTLDVRHPEARGLSLYHSFALWMSLVRAVIFLVAIGGKRVFHKLESYVERRPARMAAAKKQLQDSHAGHSERSISRSRDGVV